MTPSKSAARPKRSKSGTKGAAAAEEAPKLPAVQHALVPTHEVLSAEESQKVLSALETAPERLPKILYDDPGLWTDPSYRAISDSADGARSLVGRLVRVRRPSPTAGEAAVYRVVVGGASLRED
ncbi:MAG: DNA-directed RNA polymerase subunit H [Euryarchaeota archaeon]|nr:DNA-directed RNA polymerase subunit H [Euryarchaeota archaeon]MDE2046253.1 DNA-directed RNA polymerase subunit H [Thermoplasmata archaeon]